ncbi:PadR family transcriptional regulator [Thermasporomyces composti]|uniref:PadR family transcriptional regulator n=1 Tax=Thermasporomyces composti TaxID=696763 RepID=A0A3D9V825_THECX|nr:PadR family transcriptional regulator [Thermasporomyces composti]REF36300.1 PadR family transcriptional regulator [Thermasporomyces composti]
MARRPSNRDLVELTVLTLLAHGPKHPYELHRFILDTHKDYVTGLPRSLYHAVDRLAAHELIQPVATSRAGRRPERTVYQITAEGRAELGSRLTRLLEQPDPDSTVLSAAVSLCGSLPPAAVERALQTRAVTLEATLKALDAHAAGLQERGLPRVLVLELESERAIRSAELTWVRQILAELRDGTLTWQPLLEEHEIGPSGGSSGKEVSATDH